MSIRFHRGVSSSQLTPAPLHGLPSLKSFSGLCPLCLICIVTGVLTVPRGPYEKNEKHVPLLLPLTHGSAPHSMLNIAEVLASARQPWAPDGGSGSASGTLGTVAHLMPLSSLGPCPCPCPLSWCQAPDLQADQCWGLKLFMDKGAWG